MAGTIDLDVKSELAMLLRRLGASFEKQSEFGERHTVVVAMIFSNRWSNWEISLFMRTVSYELSFELIFHVMRREELRRCLARQYIRCKAFEVGCDSIL